jgi:hypothetical protein
MTIGIGKETSVKLSSSYVPYSRYSKTRNKPGKLVGIIAVQPEGFKEGDYNPLVLNWVVSPHRRDFNQVVDQMETSGKLPDYEASLFESCFKGW